MPNQKGHSSKRSTSTSNGCPLHYHLASLAPMTSSGTASGLPLRLGDEGVAVRDLHRRLAASGYSVTGHPERFSPATETSLKAFQASRRLSEDGICGRQTWAALVEAAHNLGDRMLYLRSPMTRGDDVTDLQQRLGSLGFDAGYVDGIFGPDTELAVRNFQHNQAVTADGVVGPGTVQALARLAGRSSGEKTITEVREKENLRRTAPSIEKRRFVIGETGGIPGIVDTSGPPPAPRWSQSVNPSSPRSIDPSTRRQRVGRRGLYRDHSGGRRPDGGVLQDRWFYFRRGTRTRPTIKRASQ